MKVQLKEITIRELVNGYKDDQENGVFGYGGKLDIRPPYQREFVYKDEQREAVIDTVIKGFPLNVLYWAVREDGDFEVIDGQQRIISICQFVNRQFILKSAKSGNMQGRGFANMQDDEVDNLMDYKLIVYFCSGEPSEKLEWFETINIAGEELTKQELRNAVYSGSWVSDAKRYFSKSGCAAYGIGRDYLNGSPIRQDYLETAIKWMSNNHINEFMAKNQHKPNANDLWLYFQSVVNWTKTVFPKYRKEMKGLPWGFIYNQLKGESFDSVELEKEVSELMMDEDVSKPSGIYQYVLTGEKKHLSIRGFRKRQKRQAYEEQKGICAKCRKEFKFNEMEADHITPWHLGGQTIQENCQMLCREDNRRKSGK